MSLRLVRSALLACAALVAAGTLAPAHAQWHGGHAGFGREGYGREGFRGGFHGDRGDRGYRAQERFRHERWAHRRPPIFYGARGYGPPPVYYAPYGY